MNPSSNMFSSYHTIYRLATTFTDLKSFAIGIARIYKNAFKADKVTVVLRAISSTTYIKISFKNKTKISKKGGISILTKVEKNILKQENEIILDKRLIYPFTFVKTLGGIYIKRGKNLKKFSAREKKWFYSLCEEASLALKIFTLYKEQQKLILSYIKSISTFLSQHVPTSRLHTKQILRILKAMEKELSLSKAEIKSLEFAALLHDAGKINLPKKLLKKQKPLTAKEFELITKHPKKGTELIKDLESLKPVMPIVLYHHERYDGKGYPSGLKKDQIPLGARILSVIDSFDAMYFGRPYRKGSSLETVKEELKKQKGKQFDPKVVDVFLKILRRKAIKKILEK
ncbi:MAG: HD domain-containing protein [Candidatus Omnitrophica bacterium]|nr:HD domain-containing protein [Candidatus Omnitrophota bacterium]MCF7878084.1 HD domain-containing protein [Candidatus Omnitrophota bacterium]MCF7893013.1 HD domain-containing protein [Candidatus Omnitrophota bacterium]